MYRLMKYLCMVCSHLAITRFKLFHRWLFTGGFTYLWKDISMTCDQSMEADAWHSVYSESYLEPERCAEMELECAGKVKGIISKRHFRNADLLSASNVKLRYLQIA